MSEFHFEGDRAPVKRDLHPGVLALLYNLTHPGNEDIDPISLEGLSRVIHSDEEILYATEVITQWASESADEE